MRILDWVLITLVLGAFVADVIMSRRVARLEISVRDLRRSAQRELNRLHERLRRVTRG